MVGKGFKFSVGRGLAKLLFWGAMALLFLLCNKYIFKNVKADTLYPNPAGYFLTLGGTNIITAPNKYFFQEPNVDTQISVKLQISPGWTPEENTEAYSFLILPYCAEKNYKPSFNLTGTCNESCFSRNSVINYFTNETCNFKYGSYDITGKKGYLQLRINKSKDFGGGGIEVTDNLIILKNNEMSARWLVWFNNPFSSTMDIYSSLAQSQELNDKTNEKIDNISDSLTDTSDADSSKFNNLAGWLPHQPLEVLVNLPLNITTAFNNSFSGSCRPYDIPFLGNTITFPCVIDKITPHLGVLVPIIDECVAIFIYIQIIMALYSFVHEIMELRDDSYFVTIWTEPGKKWRVYN